MRFAILASLISSAALLTACSDGPAENAGEDIDDAVEEVTGEEQSTFEDAGEEVDEATDEPHQN